MIIVTSQCAGKVGAVQQVVNEKENDLKAIVGDDGTWRAQWCLAFYAQ
jgi:hypothetical protein